ncbi:MAG: IclR family transcriptional regulator [Burkholderiales bacterium]|nr:IclR family transcriptional regulator [Burkholderiales bacterium]ODU72384.1 MAG: IclR family transcriptional regulator [Lautropia sp. SCN 66-9]
MSSPARVFAVLSLFTRDRPIWQPDEINEALSYARATGYRYVKELVEAGFLQKLSVGRYALGPRIIELDYQLRQSDPVLLAAMPVMEELARSSGYDAVLSVFFGRMQVIDTYRASVQPGLKLTYGRGRPRPLFQSGAPKILLSSLPRPRLLRLYDQHAREIAEQGMGQSWIEFRGYLTRVRKQGFYLSRGELEPGVGAAVVPVLNDEGDTVAALALVGPAERLGDERAPQLRTLLDQAARQIQDRLAWHEPAGHDSRNGI